MTQPRSSPKFLHFDLMIHLFKLEQTWMRYFLDGPPTKLCTMTLSNIQDGHHG